MMEALLARFLSRMSRTPTNEDVWTFSCWLKPSSFGNNSDGRAILSADGSSNQMNQIALGEEEGKLNMRGGGGYIWKSTRVLRDPSSWYHLVFTRNDTTFTAYVNGEAVVDLDNAVTAAELAATRFNKDGITQSNWL